MKQKLSIFLVFSTFLHVSFAQTTSHIPFLSKNGKYGYCDLNQKILLPTIYDRVELFSEGMARIEIEEMDTVMKKSSKRKYFINTSGKKLILNGAGKICFDIDDEFGSFKEGMAIVESINGYGFINKKGEEVIPCQYEEIHNFSEGLALVKSESFIGFIDVIGNEVISLTYYPNAADNFDLHSDFSDGIASVFNTGGKDRSGYIDKTGNEIAPFISANAFEFQEGLAVCDRIINNKIENGVINKNGDVMIPFSHAFNYFGGFNEGLIMCSDSTAQYGFRDKEGVFVIPIKYDAVFSFSDGLALVKLNGKYFYIDKFGEIKVLLDKYRFEDNENNISQFSEGLAEIVIDHNGFKYGFINRAGVEIITPKYVVAEKFSHGIAKVTVDLEIINGKQVHQKYFYIDKNGMEFREL